MRVTSGSHPSERKLFVPTASVHLSQSWDQNPLMRTISDQADKDNFIGIVGPQEKRNLVPDKTKPPPTSGM